MRQKSHTSRAKGAILGLFGLLVVIIIAIMGTMEDADSAFQSPVATPEVWTQEIPVIGTPALPSCDGGEAPCYGPLPTPMPMQEVKAVVPSAPTQERDGDDEDDYEPVIIPQATVSPLENITSLPVTGG